MSIIRKITSLLFMNPSRIYDYAFRVLIFFLPFATLFSVFFREKLGIPGISFIKELCILIMLCVILIEHLRGKLHIIWTRYDLAIWLYAFILIIVTFSTTGITGLIYGGRYDFAFLVLFFIVYHGSWLLEQKHVYYIRLFLISSGVALFLSMLLKWPLSEDILLYFGYSGNPSNWEFGSSVPIFHGVEGANVRRFQGIFDGPNTMGAFLLIYLGMFVYYFRQYKSWYFVLGLFTLGMITLVNYTYSRSAQLGYIGGMGIIVLLSFGYLYRHYKVQMVSLIVLFIIGFWVLLLQYGGNLQAIIERSGSSKGHAERMIIWVQRAVEHPLGQWLWSAGPGYRYILDLEKLSRPEIEKLDVTYIPESWYIQQFVEWGFLWGILFILLMFLFLQWLYRVHIILAGTFLSILIMNFFLHTFESSLISLSLFLLIGLLLSPHTSQKHAA